MKTIYEKLYKLFNWFFDGNMMNFLILITTLGTVFGKYSWFQFFIMCSILAFLTYSKVER
jgi:hypothetical protein